MDRLTLYVAVVWILSCLLSQGFAITKPQITMRRQDRTVIGSPADELIGAVITITCTFDLEEPSPEVLSVYKVILRTREMSKPWTNEAECTFANKQAPNREVLDEKTLDIKVEDIACGATGDSAAFNVTIPLDKDRATYECFARDQVHSKVPTRQSDPVTLKGHTIPDDPKITVDPSGPLEDGDAARFTCTSKAAPAPKLTLMLNETLVKTMPDGNDVRVVAQSAIEWQVNVDSTMNNKVLKCQVDHRYGFKVADALLSLQVIYGPLKNAKKEVKDYNVNTDRKLELVCVMNAHPTPEYEWFDGTTSLHTGAKFTVPTSYYKGLRKGKYPLTLSFKCVGRNPTTKSTGEKVFTVAVKDEDIVPSSTATDVVAPGTRRPVGVTEKAGLEGYEIALIVIGVIILFVILIAVVFLVKRNRNSQSSAARSKAAQARRPSDDRADTSKYQSSTASLNRQQDANRAANYHENPTLPMEYRYASGNVEQYAEVIDDMPRSRKPIALEDLDINGSQMYGEPYAYGEAPPAYTDSTNPYKTEPSYSTYSPSYGSSYGAAC